MEPYSSLEAYNKQVMEEFHAFKFPFACIKIHYWFTAVTIIRDKITATF